MSLRPSAALSEGEFKLLEDAIDRCCAGVRLCHMREAEREFDAVRSSGIHELTWAILIDFTEAPPLCVTWAQDGLGDPFRLSLCDANTVLAIDSVSVQIVSDRAPWSSVIGERCSSIISHTYRSNYARRVSPESWHDVLWGLELQFPSLTFMVAAARHGHAFSEPSASDELVLAYTAESIAGLRRLRLGYVEEWSEG